MNLTTLGPRICILGPSNSGKSTLAAAIARATALPPIYLDQLSHLPHTDFVPRPPEEFAALHNAAIAAERWVIEGNYTRLLPQRLARATGFILLDTPTLTSLYRYVRRSWLEPNRAGALEGGRDSVKWEMIRYIATETRANRKRAKSTFDAIALPKIALTTSRALAAFYQANGLCRRPQNHTKIN